MAASGSTAKPVKAAICMSGAEVSSVAVSSAVLNAPIGGSGAVRLRGTRGTDGEPAGALWRGCPAEGIGRGGHVWLEDMGGFGAHRCLGTE
jgi:hypothetical protein